MNKMFHTTCGSESYYTPCSVLTGANHEFLSFGYDAENRYAEAEESEEECVYELYEHINKLLLNDQHVTSSTRITSVKGHERPALDLFVMVITYLKKHLLEVLRNVMVVGESYPYFHWVIIVPGVCTEVTKHFLRQAAFEAGCIDTMNSRQLMILPSAEAAAYGCMLIDVPKCYGAEGLEHLMFAPDKKTLLLNAAGGRYETSVLIHMQSFDFKQLYASSGALINPEEMFVALLKEVFGQQFIDAFKQDCSTLWLSMLKDFERQKKGLKPDAIIGISLPYMMNHKYSQMCNESLEVAINRTADLGVRFKNGILVISSETTWSLLEPVGAQIQEVMNLSLLRSVSYLILVGELGICPAIRKSVQAGIPSGVRFIVPDDADLTVIKGAVRYIHEKIAHKRICERIIIS